MPPSLVRQIKNSRFAKEFGGILLALLGITVFFSSMSPYFFTLNNLLAVFLQVSIISITAFGMTSVLIVGAIDLSVGSVIALCGMIFSLVLGLSQSLWLSIPAALLTGFTAGLFNGLIFSRLGIPSFIVTVATLGIFRGLAFALTDSKPVPIDHAGALVIGNERFLFLPIPVWIVVFVLITTHVILQMTKIGRQARLTGGNRESARYAGVNIPAIETIVFIISGLTAAISGIILASRLYSAQPNSATGYELDAIAAAVLGGTSLSGGHGSIPGTCIGALMIGIVNNGMNLIGLPYFYQLIIKGIIIIVAVYVDMRNKMDT